MAAPMLAGAGLPATSQQRLPVKADTLSRILGDMCRPGWFGIKYGNGSDLFKL